MDPRLYIENVIIQALRQPPVGNSQSSSPCPKDSMLAAYLCRSLDESNIRDLLEHLCECSRCCMVIAATNQGETESMENNISIEAITAFICNDHNNNASYTMQMLDADLAKWEAKLNLVQEPRLFDHRPCIMIVDDDRDYLTAVCESLEERFQVIPCTSGPEALEKIEESVELVVLDIKMPGMSGFQVADALLQGSYCKHIVFNTGYPGEIVPNQPDWPYRKFPFYRKDDANSLLSGIHEYF